MTLKEVYDYGCEHLNKANIEDATLDAWYLLEHITGISRGEYFMDMNRSLDEMQEKRYCEYIRIRANHIPLQHITGTQEFMGLEFYVNEHVLIPRQDTEVLVERVLYDLMPGMKVLDMCTGSGCILVSIMKLKQGVFGTGVDISEAALEIATRNVTQHQIEAELLQSDLFEKVQGEFDVIVSNPPYIRTAVIEQLQDEVKFHDPLLALDGKEDGLYFYKRIVAESPNYLKKGGKLYFEIGHDQGEAVSTLMKDAGYTDVTVKKDLSGLDRVVFGVYNV